MNMEINLDFEYLDKLPSDAYWRFVDKYIDYCSKVWCAMEKEYLEKKGLKEVKTYDEHKRMNRAINNRKPIKLIKNNLMKLNFRWINN